MQILKVLKGLTLAKRRWFQKAYINVLRFEWKGGREGGEEERNREGGKDITS